MKKCYLFGYGSLINSTSRAITGLTGESLPVRVKGIKRSWWASSSDYSMSSVGTEADPQSICNGVLFPIDQKELPNFDIREQGYNRELLPQSQIDFLLPGTTIAADVWIYFIKNANTPIFDKPIVQSYVDVIISGCMEIGSEFTEEFLKTTSGWQYPWIDDRSQPRYPRPIENNKIHNKIDQIIQSHIPNLLDHRTAA